MARYDVVVVGGGAGGIAAALAAKAIHPEKSVLVIRRTSKMPIPCGVPYIFGTLKSIEKDLIPDGIYEKHKIDLLIDEVIEIDRSAKVVKTKGGKTFEYDKLIIATGAFPFKPPIPGSDLKGVFPVTKEYESLCDMVKGISAAKKVVIIGGGFVGVELADDLRHIEGIDIHLVEVSPRLMPKSLDPEFSDIAKEELEKMGIHLHLGKKVTRIEGKDHVEKVVLDDGTEIQTDIVIFATGVRPNTELAKKAGIALNERGAIKVNAYMQTNDPNIFAVGDCAEKRSFFTKDLLGAFFASIAVIEGRIAAINLFGNVVAPGLNEGFIVPYATKVGDTAFAAAGLTEENAKRNGFDVIAVSTETVNRHPGALPGAKKIKFKAVYTKDDLKLIGVQIAGPDSVADMASYASTIIHGRMSAFDIISIEMATQPMLTPSPIVYPLHVTAVHAIAKRKELGK